MVSFLLPTVTHIEIGNIKKDSAIERLNDRIISSNKYNIKIIKPFYKECNAHMRIECYKATYLRQLFYLS